MTKPGETDESGWIAAAKLGNHTAFQSLASRHIESLLRSARTLCHDQQLAEDITQETLIEAWRCIERFDGRCKFSTWLYGILRNRFLKALRSNKRHQSVPIIEPEMQLTSGTDSNPASGLETQESAERIRQVVADLPTEHRQVIELRFFTDCSLSDIAVVLDVPLGTVKSRLHHALEKLRKKNLLMNLLPSSGESQAG